MGVSRSALPLFRERKIGGNPTLIDHTLTERGRVAFCSFALTPVAHGRQTAKASEKKLALLREQPGRSPLNLIRAFCGPSAEVKIFFTGKVPSAPPGL